MIGFVRPLQSPSYDRMKALAMLLAVSCAAGSEPATSGSTEGSSSGGSNAESQSDGPAPEESTSGPEDPSSSTSESTEEASAGSAPDDDTATGADAETTEATTSSSTSTGTTAPESTSEASEADGSGSETETEGTSDPLYILGADISSIQEAEHLGTTYRDTDGQTKPMLELLKNHGFNYVRLRIFVDPLAPYGYASDDRCPGRAQAYNDRDHTVAYAQEVKAAGMGFLLDFHYSDTWADPAKQVIPQSWRDLGSIDALADAVAEHTTDVLTALQAVDALPDMVQVGNEITPGMLIHVPTSNTDCYGNDSQTTSPNGSTSNWTNLATLLRAGTQAVREIDPEIKVVLHIENTDDLAGARWWVQNARSNAIDFDVLGLSAYEAFQGPPSTWRATLEALAAEFEDLEFILAEYNPRRREANDIVRELPEGRGLGTFFWEPTQSGSWGNSMFSGQAPTLTANEDDFAEFDQMVLDYGL